MKYVTYGHYYVTSQLFNSSKLTPQADICYIA